MVFWCCASGGSFLMPDGITLPELLPFYIPSTFLFVALEISSGLILLWPSCDRFWCRRRARKVASPQ